MEYNRFGKYLQCPTHMSILIISLIHLDIYTTLHAHIYPHFPGPSSLVTRIFTYHLILLL
jgi:hypothetical protein